MEARTIKVLFLFPRSAESDGLGDFVAGTFVPGLRQARGVQGVAESADASVSNTDERKLV
jgi:hypothetical protein